MSASRRPVALPSRASATARLAATVDLPTPPLPEATAMMRLDARHRRRARLRRRVAADLQVGRRRRLRRRPVRGQQRRDPGDAGERRDGRLGRPPHRLERRASRRVDLEDEADTLVLDGQRPDDVGLDDAPAGARHLDGAERREHGFARDAHRLLPTRIAAAAGRRLAFLDRAPPGRRQGPAADNRCAPPAIREPARFAIMFTRKLRSGDAADAIARQAYRKVI